MQWVRLDTSFPTNPKVLELIQAKKHAAVVAYVSSLAYSGAHETDGFIPGNALPFVHGTKRIAADLVAVGLWDSMPTGFAIHGWEEYQPSAEEAKMRAEKGRKAALARWAKANGGEPVQLHAVPDQGATG
ncbi:hypothetical protein SEA_SONALI_49 [Arthrobacter phage Sonali]|uniref:Uncharacterized protein n=1 Tax=Arthrobacter phage Sonali TaxID=2510495 RepID=A0A411CQG5_9CAUD|nr:replication initiation protein [Arthrobacter phage Sonali]QAY16161.1 hypothetical protein SEA_SONALI_49 [Arthrobacter phage Sonali]